jgi:hypothetical protein
MGLSLVVAILADRKGFDDEGADHYRRQFDAVNQALRDAGLPPPHEPESLEFSYSEDLSGYSVIHHLRQIAADSWAGQELPTPEAGDPSKDPLVEEYEENLRPRPVSRLSRWFGKSRPTSPRYDHLMFHCDAEGYYLPQDFAEVIFPDRRLRIAGEMIGSTVRLHRECEALARLLGIPPELDPDGDALRNAVENPATEGPAWKAHGIAAQACLKLRAAASFSLAPKAAIVFT